MVAKLRQSGKTDSDSAKEVPVARFGGSMKRVLFCLLCCMPCIFLSISFANAAPLPQEDNASGEVDLFSMIGTISNVFTGVVDAAVSQIPEGGLDLQAEPTAVPETLPSAEPSAEPVAEPLDKPSAVPTEVPAAEPAAVPTEEPILQPVVSSASTDANLPVFSSQSEQAAAAPADPEKYAVSTGIMIDEFYNELKTTIKNNGRHSVSFEKKGRKSASKIVIDDNINVYLYYNKANGDNVLDHIDFEAEMDGAGQAADAEEMLYYVIDVLVNYLDIDFDGTQNAGLFRTMMNDGSAVVDDLLFYGKTIYDENSTALTVSIYYTGSGYDAPQTTTYSQSAEDDFRGLIAFLKDRGVIPSVNGTVHFQEDYKSEWAQINWYQWETFDQAQNFVISTDIEWESASNTPNFADSGCGFVLRSQDTNNNLYAALNMDGKVHFGGIKSGSWLSYGSYPYGQHSTKGKAQFVVIANGDTLTAYVDGAPVGQQKNLAILQPGGLAFSVWSGTNKDFGTRCTFKNVYYYVW